MAGIAISDRVKATLEAAEVGFSGARPEGVRFSFLSRQNLQQSQSLLNFEPEALELDRRLRAKFDFIPIHWFKIGLRKNELSIYWTIHPANTYPITTLRLFLRKYGAETDGLEETLKPALEQPGSTAGVALKGKAPRVFCKFPHHLLPVVLEHGLQNGWIQGEERALYLSWQERLSPKDDSSLWISLDGFTRRSAVDFEDVSPEGIALPPLEGVMKIPYLKVRLDSIKTFWPYAELTAELKSRVSLLLQERTPGLI